MKRFLIFSFIICCLLISFVFWFGSWSDGEQAVLSLIPADGLKGIAVLAEDASEQGVRTWLEEWFFLKKISPVSRLFFRHFFPRSTTLALYPTASGKVDWLLVGELGNKAKLINWLRFVWEKRLQTFYSIEGEHQQIGDQKTKLYSFTNRKYPAFFPYGNFLLTCSSQDVYDKTVKHLAANSDTQLPIPAKIEAELFKTDGNRDGNFYLANQEHFWDQFSHNIVHNSAGNLEDFSKLVKSVRGSFDFVDLNRFRLIMFFKIKNEFHKIARKQLTEWGKIAKIVFANVGIDLEFILKEHPEWEEIRLIFYPHKIGRYFAYLENAAAARMAQTGSSFSGFTLTESELDQISWSLTAKKATVDGDETKITCVGLTYKLFEEGKIQVELTSQSGIISRDPLIITATDKVWLKAGDNVIETEKLVWDKESNLISTDQAVKITRKDDIMTGKGLTATPDLKNIKVLADVKITLKEMPAAAKKL